MEDVLRRRVLLASLLAANLEATGFSLFSLSGFTSDATTFRGDKFTLLSPRTFRTGAGEATTMMSLCSAFEGFAFSEFFGCSPLLFRLNVKSPLLGGLIGFSFSRSASLRLAPVRNIEGCSPSGFAGGSARSECLLISNLDCPSFRFRLVSKLTVRLAGSTSSSVAASAFGGETFPFNGEALLVGSS
jgi:hypothetical protein